MDWMTRCAQCDSRQLRKAHVTADRNVAGIEFTAELAALKCAKCGEEYVSDETLKGFELAVAIELGSHGKATPDALKFMRKALGMRAVDLAGLLGVTADTVSRWERGAVPIDAVVFAVLGFLALDARDGKSTMLEFLKAHQEQWTPREPVKVKVTAA